MEWLPLAAYALPKILSAGTQLKTAIDTTKWAASWINWGISGPPPAPVERWQWIERGKQEKGDPENSGSSDDLDDFELIEEE